MTDTEPALELLSINKRFGSTVALANASLSVRRGSLHMLLGENGAGKTTLLNVAAGLQRPDSGEVRLNGRTVRWRSRREAMDSGVGAVHQHLSLVPAMTVSENVALGNPVIAARFHPKAAADAVRRIVDASGLTVDPDAIVGDLPVAARQRVEIVKAIAHNPEILLLDEPTSALSPPDIRDLFAWLRTFVASGCTVVVITHRLREALQHGDAITVLRSGRAVITTDASSITEAVVLTAMLGEIEGGLLPTRSARSQSISRDSAPLRLSDVGVVDDVGVLRLKDVTLSAHSGQILGVCGVEGAGQQELLRVLAGRRAPSVGVATLRGSIAFVPEDRLRDGLSEELSLMENFALKGAGSRRGLMRWKHVESSTTAAIAAFDVKGGAVSTPAGALSGGNQQRFVLARELADTPAAIVAENPTSGLDVRASRSVFARLRAASDAGAAVVVYSTDVEEIVSVADRVVVCHAGSVVEVPVEPGAIGAAMVGAR